MNILLFGGTSEGRELAEWLSGEGFGLTLCVATEYGASLVPELPGLEVHTGRLDRSGMEQLLAGGGFDRVVDATHPYAVEATKNIRAAAARAGVKYRRLLRAPSPLPEGALVFAGAAEAARELARTEGNVLLTTGAKELGAFSPIAPERCYPRVLPTQEGIAACEAAGVPHRNIIAMQGPFSRALNEALIQQFEIRWLVTKDGGAAGGFAEKVQAAQSTGAQLVVLRRPPEQGQTAQEILNLCKEKML